MKKIATFSVPFSFYCHWFATEPECLKVHQREKLRRNKVQGEKDRHMVI